MCFTSCYSVLLILKHLKVYKLAGLLYPRMISFLNLVKNVFKIKFGDIYMYYIKKIKAIRINVFNNMNYYI